jgi:hypothetical protein
LGYSRIVQHFCIKNTPTLRLNWQPYIGTILFSATNCVLQQFFSGDKDDSSMCE